MEYSITEEELREIIEMLGNGWYCETVEADETLYVRFSDGEETKDYHDKIKRCFIYFK